MLIFQMDSSSKILHLLLVFWSVIDVFDAEVFWKRKDSGNVYNYYMKWYNWFRLAE